MFGSHASSKMKNLKTVILSIFRYVRAFTVNCIPENINPTFSILHGTLRSPSQGLGSTHPDKFWCQCCGSKARTLSKEKVKEKDFVWLVFASNNNVICV